MNGDYSNAIATATEILVSAILASEPNLDGHVAHIDRDVGAILRRMGLAVMTRLIATCVERVTQAESVRTGLPVERRPVVSYFVQFGEVRVASPYLWASGRGSARPVQDVMGIRDRGRSSALERALSDFGAETSFGRAAARFQEHYGWKVERTAVLRVTEGIAVEAQTYVGDRLEAERKKYEQPIEARPGAAAMLVGADGSMVRTGDLVPAPDLGKTEKRGLDRRRRVEEWKEVRVGFARVLDEDDRSCVAAMDTWPNVISQVFSAAVERGLSRRTDVVAVGDGGNGLMETLTSQFPALTYVLDRPHLVEHFNDTAKELTFGDCDRKLWVEANMAVIDAGEAAEVKDYLARYTGTGQDRVHNLAAYLERFEKAVNYSAFKEKGYPIGSGEVESEHRYIPQQRMKLPGAWWHKRNVNPMLALRVMRHNDWWDDFWQTRTPTAIQNNCAPFQEAPLDYLAAAA